MKTGGTPLFLKNRCGVGCYLNVDLRAGSHNVSSLTALVEQSVPGSKVHDQSPSTISYLLPSSQTSVYAKLLHQLDDHDIKNSFGINSYGISQCTMNDVFIRICSPEGTFAEGKETTTSTTASTTESEEEETKPKNTFTVLPDDTYYAGKASIWRQFTALLKAKLLYYIRDLTSLGTMIAMPFFQTIVFIIVFTITSTEGIPQSEIGNVTLNNNYYSSPEFPVFINTTAYSNSSLTSFVNCMANTFGSTPVYYDNITLMNDELITKSGHAYGLDVAAFGSTLGKDISISVMYNNSLTQSLPLAIDAAYNCLGEMAGFKPSIRTGGVHPVSTNVIVDAVGFDAFTSAILLCCLFSLITVSFHPMQKLVEEREKGFKQQVLLAGCRPGVYILSSVVANGLVVIPPILIILLITLCFGMISFPLMMSLTLSGIIFSFAIAAFNYWVSLYFDKPQSATTTMSFVTLYLFALPFAFSLGTSIALIIFEQSLSPGALFIIRVLMFLSELIPHFTLMNTVISTSWFPQDYSLSLAYVWKSRFCIDLIALTIDIVLYFVISWAKEYKLDAIEEPHIRGNPPTFCEDQDVKREYNRVTSSASSNDALRVTRLGKVFEPPNMNCCKRFLRCLCCCGKDDNGVKERVDAVKDVTLGVSPNECFGLLGPNGSGKTTMMRMITAQLDPTYGDIELGGVAQERSRQRFYSACHMGNCPQSSGFLDYMTAREHLTLILSMRGSVDGTDAPIGVLKNDVSAILDVMDIGEHSDRQSKTYSGGYVRRMNVATALLPGVHVVVLDEPSTGMDVVSQRALWNAIRLQRQQSGKVVLLTTHSMEEAEAVCSKIAILLVGNLECYGSVQHLRDKYSDGHLATLFIRAANYTEELCTELEHAIQSSKVCRQTQHAMVNHTPASVQVTYKLSGVESLSSLFDLLESLQQSHQPAIERYSVSQASLESVFVHMVQKHEDEAAQQKQ